MNRDQDYRWLGLKPYRENDSSRFHGREREIDALHSRIARRTSTVLVAASGCGKTSLLRAGLFPELRRQGMLPVYLRINYSESAPSPLRQIWEALAEANLLQREFDFENPPDLWTWFHDTRSGLLSDRNAGICPVLVFDQFEELFTLGGLDPDQSHHEFLVQLADLLENRIPDPGDQIEKIEAQADQLENCDTEARQHRIVVAIREDYLSLLERNRQLFPSLLSNRMLIDKLDGNAARQVVLGPAEDLISKPVADEIIRFVAGDQETELHELVVDPPLLSLVCHQLEMTRGNGPITSRLVRESSKDILDDFYHSSFEGFDDKASEFIEEKFVTESGYRQNLVLPEVNKQLGEEVVKTLVDRRLLSVEQSGKLSRVELSHDILVPVVLRARDSRRSAAKAKEAEKSRLLAEKRLEKERSRRRRSVVIASLTGIFGVLALIAAITSIYFWQESKARTEEAIKAEEATQNLNRELQNKQITLKENEKNLEELLAKNQELLIQAKESTKEAEEQKDEAVSAQKLIRMLLESTLDASNKLISGQQGREFIVGPRTRLIQIQQALGFFEDMLDQSDRLPEDVRTGLAESIASQTLRAHLNQALAYRELFEFESAHESLAKARGLLKAAKDNEATQALWIEYWEDKGEVAYHEGLSWIRRRGTYEGEKAKEENERVEKRAEACFKEAKSAFAKGEELSAKDTLVRIRLSNQRANSCRRLYEWNEAKKTLTDNLQRLTTLPDDDVEGIILRADTRNKIGALYISLHTRRKFSVTKNPLEQGERALTEAIREIGEARETNPEQINLAYQQAIAHANLGDIYYEKDRENKAWKEQYTQRQVLAQICFKHSGETPFYRNFLAEGFRFLAIKEDGTANPDKDEYLFNATQAAMYDQLRTPTILRTYRLGLRKHKRTSEVQRITEIIEARERELGLR